MRHQPEGLEQLQAQTKFTKKELQSLYRGFKSVSAQGRVSGSGRSPMGLTWCPFCPPRSAPAAGWTRRPSRSSTRNSSRRAVSGGAPGWRHPPQKKIWGAPTPPLPLSPLRRRQRLRSLLVHRLRRRRQRGALLRGEQWGDTSATGGRRCRRGTPVPPPSAVLSVPSSVIHQIGVPGRAV